MDTLTALEELSVQSLKLSFCEGVCLPFKLQSFKIQFERTMPPVMKWGLQGLTALSILSIGGCDDTVNGAVATRLPCVSDYQLSGEMKSFQGNGLQQLESFPENCLPSSLKSLKFAFCERLESLLEESLPNSLNRLLTILLTSHLLIYYLSNIFTSSMILCKLLIELSLICISILYFLYSFQEKPK